MKRNLWIPAALLLAAGACTKEADFRETPAGDGEEWEIYLCPVQDDGTKTTWEEGQDYITWEEGDLLTLFRLEEGNTNFTSTGNYGDTHVTLPYDATNQAFRYRASTSENIKKWAVGDVLYAVYPSTAASVTSQNPTNIGITVPAIQTPGQKGFDMAADIMLGRPITLEKAPSTRSYDKLDLKLGHLSTFLCFAFDSAEYGDELVLGAELCSSTQLAGSFVCRMDMDVFHEGVVWGTQSSYSSYKSIHIDGQGLKLNQFKAWFATMPLAHEDLAVVVHTAAHTLTFTVGAKKLAASKILKRTLKTPASAESTIIALAENEMWEHIPGVAVQKALGSGENKTEAVWGGSPNGNPAATTWDITYEGNAGTPSQTSVRNFYVDQLNSSTSTLADDYKHYGTIYLTSRNIFENISRINIQAGLYDSSTSAGDIDASIYLVDESGRRTRIKSFTAHWAGDYSFEITQYDSSTPLRGRIQFVFNEAQNRLDGQVCIRHLSVNQAPRITTEVDDISLRTAGAATGSIATTVEFIDDFSVSCLEADGTGASWIHASYDIFEGTLRYTIDENTGDADRRGIIRITGIGLSTVSKDITVFQYGAQRVLRTYVLDITPYDLSTACTPGEDEVPEITVDVDGALTLQAVAADGSGKVKDIPLKVDHAKVYFRRWMTGATLYDNSYFYFDKGDGWYGYIANTAALPGAVTCFEFQSTRIVPYVSMVINNGYVCLYLEDTDLSQGNPASPLTPCLFYNSSFSIQGQYSGEETFNKPICTLLDSWMEANGKTGMHWFHLRRGSTDLSKSPYAVQYQRIRFTFDVEEAK